MPRMPNPMAEITSIPNAFFDIAPPAELAKFWRSYEACRGARLARRTIPELCALPAAIAAYKRVASPEDFALYERRRAVWWDEAEKRRALLMAQRDEIRALYRAEGNDDFEGVPDDE